MAFGRWLIVLPTKYICYTSYTNGPKALSSASDKAKLFREIFPQNSIFDESCISLPAFLSRTNVKLSNIFVTPKLVKNVIIDLDSSKKSLDEVFNMCLHQSFFPDCWKVSSGACISVCCRTFSG